MPQRVGARRVLYLIGVGAWLLLVDFILVGASGHRLPRPLGVAGSWIFVAVSAALLALLGGRRRARGREQARLLRLQHDVLRALGALTEPSLASLPADQLLDEMLARLVATLGVQTATVYLFRPDGSELAARASVGREGAGGEQRIPVDQGVAGRILAERRPVCSDVASDLQVLVGGQPTLVGVAGCPIVVEDRLIGLCIVGTTTTRAFSEADIQLLQLVADRVGAGIERSRLDEAERRSRLAAEHAIGHVILLARASEALSTAIDEYEPNLAALVDVVVPDFADWCALDVVDDGGGRRRLAVRHGDDRGAACSAALAEQFPGIDDGAQSAARLGRVQPVSGPPRDAPGEAGAERPAGLIVPIRVRNRVIGLIMLAADSAREGYQRSDILAAEDMAVRTAITVERVLLYRELRAREAEWRALVEATPAAIVEVDLCGGVQVWNQFAATMFGWEGESLPDAPGFAPDTTEALSELWARAADGEEILEAQVSATVARDERRDLAVSVAHLGGGNGQLQGLLMLAVDITERRRLQEGLRQAQQMEALGQVAGGVAHDFNNLLTIITGYAELLSRRLTLSDDDRLLFDNIRNAADRASVLTGQLLTISRRQVAKPVVLSPEIAIRGILDVLQRIVGVDIALACDLDPAAGYVRIDPGRFEQLLLNLAINARDAMPDGGQLRVGADMVCLEEEGAAAQGLLPGRYVRVTVADTGVGMDSETRRRCLEPFFTTKDRSKGTGLGLAAVQGIVDDGGGAIEIRSAPDQGTTVTVLLPSAPVEESLAAETPVPPAPGFPGSETVLVVDDQGDVRQLIRKILVHDGYLVLEAASGVEAVRIAERWEGPIELLVTDVMMPGMRGPEVADAVKALRPSIAVLFVSGYAHGTALPPQVMTDPLAFLAKPFKPSELGDRVRQILDARSEKARSGSPRHARS